MPAQRPTDDRCRAGIRRLHISNSSSAVAEQILIRHLLCPDCSGSLARGDWSHQERQGLLASQRTVQPDDDQVGVRELAPERLGEDSASVRPGVETLRDALQLVVRVGDLVAATDGSRHELLPEGPVDGRVLLLESRDERAARAVEGSLVGVACAHHRSQEVLDLAVLLGGDLSADLAVVQAGAQARLVHVVLLRHCALSSPAIVVDRVDPRSEGEAEQRDDCGHANGDADTAMVPEPFHDNLLTEVYCWAAAASVVVVETVLWCRADWV